MLTHLRARYVCLYDPSRTDYLLSIYLPPPQKDAADSDLSRETASKASSASSHSGEKNRDAHSNESRVASNADSPATQNASDVSRVSAPPPHILNGSLIDAQDGIASVYCG